MKRRDVIKSGAGLVFCAPFALSACKKELQAKVSRGYEEITIREVHQMYRNHSLTAVDLTKWYLKRIEDIDRAGPTLNAMISINPNALKIAKQLDDKRNSGSQVGPLHGIPVVLKDNIDSIDPMPTTAGSRALARSYRTEDSAIAKQLRNAGAIILGKANLSEWANFRATVSSSGWSGIQGQTKNPYLLSHNPCGSSSGSAVAVSANLCSVAIGTETNGSIVCPSHANGIVGIKPTVGLISRSGIIPISHTQDTAGPMARTVSDAAILLGAIVSEDPKDDKTSAKDRVAHTDYTQFLNPRGLHGKRIGCYLQKDNFTPEVVKIFAEAKKKITEAGAKIIELQHINTVNVNDDSFNVMLFEFKDGLNRYLSTIKDTTMPQSLDELIRFNALDSIELKYFNQKLLEMANEKEDLNAKEYLQSLEKMLTETRTNGIDKVIREYNLDAIISPTGSQAWQTDLENGDDYLGGSSSPAAQSGYPNINIPMGFAGLLPVGISIYGQAWREDKLIEIAFGLEQKLNARRIPEFIME